MSTKNNQVDDPRNSALETPFVLPKTWHQESSDGASSSGMFLSGLIMLTRNRFLAWPSLLFGLVTTINEHPLRSDAKALHGWSNLILCFFVLIASYIPVFVLSKTPTTVLPPAV